MTDDWPSDEVLSSKQEAKTVEVKVDTGGETKKVPNRKAKRGWGLRKTAKNGRTKRNKLRVSIPPAEQPWRTHVNE